MRFSMGLLNGMLQFSESFIGHILKCTSWGKNSSQTASNAVNYTVSACCCLEEQSCKQSHSLLSVSFRTDGLEVSISKRENLQSFLSSFTAFHYFFFLLQELWYCSLDARLKKLSTRWCTDSTQICKFHSLFYFFSKAPNRGQNSYWIITLLGKTRKRENGDTIMGEN